ncbi:MAG: FixH family protein [Chitinophagaceae bacterium]
MNWGHKLTVVFIAFAAMMSYLAYRAFKTEFELVDKDYYKSELRYQEVIDGTNHANALSAMPIVKQSGDSIVLQMPVELLNRNVSGTVYFYCAADSKKDRRFSLELVQGKQSFQHQLKPGYYTVKIDWLDAGRNYYSENKLSIL